MHGLEHMQTEIKKNVILYISVTRNCDILFHLPSRLSSTFPGINKVYIMDQYCITLNLEISIHV